MRKSDRSEGNVLGLRRGIETIHIPFGTSFATFLLLYH